MPEAAQAIDFSKYADVAPASASIDFSKYEETGKPDQRSYTVDREGNRTKEDSLTGFQRIPEDPELGKHSLQYGGAAAALGAGVAAGAPAAVAAGVRKVAPYAVPSLMSTAISKAREFPVIGPIIDKIPYAEALPWLFTGHGKAAEEPVNPGAPFPEKPPAEVFQSRGLERGGAAPPPEPSAGLGKLPVPPVEGPAPIAMQPKGVVSKQLDTGLREGLGAPPPVRPGVPMREQFKTPAEAIPEGHTPAQSTAVKSFKYDAPTQELHITSKDGTTHVYGEVTPAQAEEFQNAKSKGTAWKAIRDNNVRVAKILPNGVRTASKGASEFRTASPESKAPTVAAPGEDLEPILRRSLKQAKRTQ